MYFPETFNQGIKGLSMVNLVFKKKSWSLKNHITFIYLK